MHNNKNIDETIGQELVDAIVTKFKKIIIFYLTVERACREVITAKGEEF